MTPLTWTERQELAQRFAPHLVLFPEDRTLPRPGNEKGIIGDYHPRGVHLLLEQSILATQWWEAHIVATIDALAACMNPKGQLQLLGRMLPDPKHAWQKYFQLLDRVDASGQPGKARHPVTVYARVQTRAEANAASQDKTKLGKDAPPFPEEVGRPFFTPTQFADDDVVIQYWFCYYYDDWVNQHEGDWEGVSIFLRRAGNDYVGVGASYNAHETGKRRHWSQVEKSDEGNTHPLVFVAAGSHASYFSFVQAGYWTTVPGFIVPFLGLRFKVDLSTTRVDRVADARQVKPIVPRVELLPDPVGPADRNDPAWAHKKWLAFPGSWGVRVFTGLAYGGPLGPSHKGLKWRNPFVWSERYCTPDYLVY